MHDHSEHRYCRAQRGTYQRCFPYGTVTLRISACACLHLPSLLLSFFLGYQNQGYLPTHSKVFASTIKGIRFHNQGHLLRRVTCLGVNLGFQTQQRKVVAQSKSVSHMGRKMDKRLASVLVPEKMSWATARGPSGSAKHELRRLRDRV